ncbi:hypothetical protein BBJ28_00014639 [Nothophytophthora sp. Chile5]|nr:hypothetical protein BBJ28_00014639 [Nothophytophthora sp. Chile5]
MQPSDACDLLCANLQVAQTRDDTEEAKGHLRQLACKAFTSRIVLLVVILALMVAIVLVAYYKWYPRDQKDYLGILPKSTTAANSTSV